VTIGFILSPLSWWNDFVINFPISYAIAFPFGVVSEKLFIPMFIIAYWLTNIIGFIMMHHGVKNLFNKDINHKKTKKEFKKVIIISFIYTLFILVLIYLDILKFPEEFMNKLM
jgi:hypothetical protein